MQRRARLLSRLLFLGLILAFVLAACATPVGSLLVTVTGLPGGEDADITVTGPGSYSASVTETTTLTGLTPGTYSISADTVTTTAVTSDYAPTVTPSTVAVAANTTATTTVTYELEAGTLDVAISGLPGGTDADVTVTGPGGFTQDLTATTLLADLDPGEYTASAEPVTDGTNTYNPTVSGSPAEVSSNSGAAIDIEYEAEPGNLSVTLNGLTSGVDGDVSVTGPGGFSETVTSSTTFTNLAPGTYNLSAGDVRSDNPIVSEIFLVTIPPAASVEVTSDTTASASTTYSKLGGTGRLWVPNQNDPMLHGYTPGQLATSGAPTPDVVITVTGGATDEAVAFDGNGNAWVSNLSSDTVSRVGVGVLEADATITPGIVLGSDGTSLSNPIGLAFDAAGNLWVAANVGDTLEMFTPAQLAASGTPTPAVIIGSDGTSLGSPCGIAFDGSGNLWVQNLDGSGIQMFTSAQLAASGTPTPSVTIGSDGTSFGFACSIAFDAAGNLWATAGFTDRLEMFTPAQLAASGTPTPAVIIGSDGASLDLPLALAFDNSGNLWVNNNSSERIEMFTPAQLAASGTPTPSVIITGNDTDLGGLAFSPPPVDMPINTP